MDGWMDGWEMSSSFCIQILVAEELEMTWTNDGNIHRVAESDVMRAPKLLFQAQ